MVAYAENSVIRHESCKKVRFLL